MSFYSYRRRVQFADTDLAGIVHFSMMFRYIEEAEHALWRAAGLSIADPSNDLGWPRLTAALEFRQPLRFEDEVEVAIRVSSATTRTIEYECVLRRGETVVAAGHMKSICARKQRDGTMRAAELPPGLVEKLNQAAR
ncbi:MAG TPA: thioesterase family protein [Vicinamibacterales bacterium]|nr:thioesterase family protein [Vicinamibacterales bacterium]